MPDSSMLDVLLTEVRAIRSEQTEHGERLARLETGLNTITGNGSPGRLTLLETQIEKLKEFRWYVMGASAAVAGIASTLFHFAH